MMFEADWIDEEKYSEIEETLPSYIVDSRLIVIDSLRNEFFNFFLHFQRLFILSRLVKSLFFFQVIGFPDG